jgi:ribulose-5-phosphate 4-epimerase/fuculose-1-phosphate aldolase
MTLACSARLREAGIPSFHPDGAAAGSDGIRCAQPAGADAAALSDRVDEALADRGACLLPAEGLLAVGSTLDAAVGMVTTVETLARVWWQLCQAEHRATDGVPA